jgi:hypothetical protein
MIIREFGNAVGGGQNERRESDLFLVMVEGVWNVCLMMDHLHSLTRSPDSNFVPGS